MLPPLGKRSDKNSWRESMNVEYTGRQYEVTPAIRKQVEHGLTKLTKIFGENNFKTLVILTSEKYRHIAEITVVVRDKPIVGLAEGTGLMPAAAQARAHTAPQALRSQGRWR